MALRDNEEVLRSPRRDHHLLDALARRQSRSRMRGASFTAVDRGASMTTRVKVYALEKMVRPRRELVFPGSWAGQGPASGRGPGIAGDPQACKLV